VARVTRGVLARIALGVGLATVLVAIGVTLAPSVARAAVPPLAQVSAATAKALAWGAGVLVAFAGSAQALQSDRRDGVRALLRARGVTAGEYAAGRVVGLAIVLAVVVAGGTFVVGLVAVLVAVRGGAGAAGVALQGLAASVVFGVAFAGVVAPLAMAALGARSRTGGYLVLLAVLAVPQALEPWTSLLVPRGWGDLLAVPSALAALRASLMPPGIDGARAARAACVLAAIAAACFAAVRAEIARVDAGPEDDEAGRIARREAP
jgi:hypothetical protein